MGDPDPQTSVYLENRFIEVRYFPANSVNNTYEYSKWIRSAFLSGFLMTVAAEFSSTSDSNLGLLLPGLLMLRLDNDPDLLVLDMLKAVLI